MERLLDKFQDYIRENELVKPSERVLLTVSGGVDSMVMLSLFARSGYAIGVAHCNFQLRGAESEEDEVLVQQEAARYGVPFYNMRFDTKGEMERTGESVQMAARRLRYDWFNALCAEYGYDAIAIAHHADDSIETFFINLLRGTGLRGLTGIHAVNGRIVRPLLFASRRDILDYAHAERIPFREDSSNRSTKYLRNKVRLGLIPRIREINPKFTEQMCANIERLTDAQLFISRGMERIRAEVVEQRDGLSVIDPARIDPAFPVDFVIYELLSAYGFKGDVIDSLCRSMRHDSTGKRFYSKENVAYIDRGKILVAPIAEEDACAVELGEEMSKLYCGNSVLYLEKLDIDDIDTPAQPENVALLDRDRLHFPLVVRRWNEGDSFVPFGMTGRKKVSDFLIDAKVPLAEKRRQFVVVDGGEGAGEIVWLVGRRIDDRFRLGSGTENVLKITREVL
ncbi:tRNA lysidine(34) synthetase TilS [Gallalistipes aquisgranensis]|uniref:tRNA lysidine(34) synthetase TilS n=1 Tax=Gallalistipes aquisgranensis TaxID=2779358 RepID=UPI001CF835E1|nr:tRNA lysidine(34) synthetase TilS [Gallalistipes aquisgranensis]MBE5032759.1 tRNA lysidine(34) synthetase TilS [Gallalistipes aquisgranensis]